MKKGSGGRITRLTLDEKGDGKEGGGVARVRRPGNAAARAAAGFGGLTAGPGELKGGGVASQSEAGGGGGSSPHCARSSCRRWLDPAAMAAAAVVVVAAAEAAPFRTQAAAP